MPCPTPLPHHPARHAIAAFAAFALCAAVWLPTAQAQTFKDPALETLYVAERFEDLQKAATPRVQARADDDQAVLALAMASLGRNDANARRDAIARAEACVAAAPKAAPCQYAHGVVLGIQAMNEGMIKAARSAGTIREALVAAHELDPAWYPARSALIDFYLVAPGMMGGSSTKAAELARSAPKPEIGQALQARVLLGDGKAEQALAVLVALPAALEPALAEDVLSWGMQSTAKLIKDGTPNAALPWLERVQREQPAQAAAPYGIARVRAETGAHEDAVKLYERAATLKGADTWPIAYRLGISLQALGKNDAARAAFEKALAATKGPTFFRDDAKKRLAQVTAPK